MIALTCAKGSPGVTTTALALTLAAPGQCLLAECDPTGGDILAGYLQGSLPADRGVAQLAVAELRGRLRDEFTAQLVDLEAPRRRLLLLPGVTDPAQSATVATAWQPLADHFRQWRESGADTTRRDVVLDCGALSTAHFGVELLQAADRVLLVVRATMPSVSAAVPAVRALRERLGAGGADRLGLVVVRIGAYQPVEIAHQLGVPVVAVVPEDPRAARALSFGGTVHRRMPLLRAAARLHARLATPSIPSREATGV
jgi:MinD-like ATPase involved in chromosome partitioning or flagellar assembly